MKWSKSRGVPTPPDKHSEMVQRLPKMVKRHPEMAYRQPRVTGGGEPYSILTDDNAFVINPQPSFAGQCAIFFWLQLSMSVAIFLK